MKRFIAFLLTAILLFSSSIAMAEEIPTGEYGVNYLKYGDINFDNAINASDALIALQTAVHKAVLEDALATVADVTDDETINATDALRILQFSVGKLDQFVSGIYYIFETAKEDTHFHIWSVTTVAPGCLTEGYTQKRCSCGESEESNFTQPAGHQWGNWVVIESATTTATGTQRRECTRCDAYEDQTVDKLPSSTAEAYQQEVLQLVNAERKKVGLHALSYYHAGQAAADLRAEEIETLFSHTRPNGEPCFTVLDNINDFYYTAGENIAMGYPTPQAVVTGWMNSEGHRANILNENFTHIIIGVNGVHWVQLFLGM